MKLFDRGECDLITRQARPRYEERACSMRCKRSGIERGRSREEAAHCARLTRAFAPLYLPPSNDEAVRQGEAGRGPLRLTHAFILRYTCR